MGHRLVLCVTGLLLLAVGCSASLLPYSDNCTIMGSGKFFANQVGISPFPCFWDVSPCDLLSDCTSTSFIRQYDSDGACDDNLLNCVTPPQSVQNTPNGYVMNFSCGESVNEYKSAIVNITCGPGPLVLYGGLGVMVTSTGPANYTYTFTMMGGNCDLPPPPTPANNCTLMGSDKFLANQTGISSGPYFWRVSPCGLNDCWSTGFVQQYDEDGACDENLLSCQNAPHSVQNTSYGYVLNFAVNGHKSAIVDITCGPGPLVLSDFGVPVTNTAPNTYTYTFNMIGGNCVPSVLAPELHGQQPRGGSHDHVHAIGILS